MSFETKNFTFEIKANLEKNEFEGYASVFNYKDSGDDIIEPGAFTKTIQESKRVKVLWQHDPYQPIGKPMYMAEDSKGLHVKAKISPTQLGKDVVQLMRDGVIDELSIGYNTVKADWDNLAGARRIKEVRLWEFSPVTFAMNDQAGVTGVKSLATGISRMSEWIDEELKAGKVLSEKNKGLVEGAIKALTALLDASEKGIEPPAGTQQPNEDEKKAAEDILGILKNMQAFASNK
jgi:hypothetical protein